MEHRCGSRRPLHGRVTLLARDARPIDAYLREASISGMFVETAPQPFCCNTVIDIEMTVPGSTGPRTYRWQAMVIRKTGDGIGLMFDRMRPPAITRLVANAEAGLVTGLPAGNVVPLAPPAGKSPRP